MFWLYPMKPVRTDDHIFDRLDMSNYDMEVKLDGFRLILVCDKGLQLYTRQKNRMIMPDNLREQLSALSLPDRTILDGEIWNYDKRGAWAHDASSICHITFWDVTRIGDKDISTLPIEERRARLNNLVKESDDIFTIKPTTASSDAFSDVKRQAMEHKIRTKSRTGFVHGVVLKRKGSPRRDHSNRSVEHPDWLKICFF
jgi:ATP-dependent DNA ligase